MKRGDIVLRAGVSTSRWKWRVLAVRGHLWWKRALIEEIKGRDNYVLEERVRELYPYHPLPAPKSNVGG